MNVIVFLVALGLLILVILIFYPRQHAPFQSPPPSPSSPPAVEPPPPNTPPNEPPRPHRERLNPMPYGVMNDRDAPQLILDKSIASTPCSSHFAALCSIAHAKSITETVADDLRSESNSSSGVQQVLQKVTRAMYDRDFSFRPIVMDSSGTIIATGRDLEVAADAPCPTDFGTGSCGQNTSIGQPFTTVAFMQSGVYQEKLWYDIGVAASKHGDGIILFQGYDGHHKRVVSHVGFIQEVNISKYAYPES